MKPDEIVNIERAILHALKSIESLPAFERQSEFKYTEFFRGCDDSTKMAALEAMVEVLDGCGAVGIVAYSYCPFERLKPHADFFGGERQAMLQFAYSHLQQIQYQIIEKTIVQPVVDLGLSESFVSLHDIYTASTRGLAAMTFMNTPESSIVPSMFRSLLPPLFVNSRESRIMMLSDVLVGLKAAEFRGELSPFKKRMLLALQPLEGKIFVSSNEWDTN